MRGSAADSLARAAEPPTVGLELPVRVLWSVVMAVTVLVITWIVGGPIGAALNAPGLLLLAAARALGAIPRLPEPEPRRVNLARLDCERTVVGAGALRGVDDWSKGKEKVRPYRMRSEWSNAD